MGLRVLKVSSCILKSLFIRDTVILDRGYTVVEGLPPDVKIEDAYMEDCQDNTVCFVVSSEEFTPHIPGEPLPLFDVTVRSN